MGIEDGPIELWRLVATHFDGTGQFQRYFPKDFDIGAETHRLEQRGWLCECDRKKLPIHGDAAALLCESIWPVAPDNEILWLLGTPSIDPRLELEMRLDRHFARASDAS